jgi:hypothetical protein
MFFTFRKTTNRLMSHWCRRREALFCTMLLAALFGGTRVRAQSPAASEYDVKAAFLFNIAKYVEWPPQALAPGGTIVIGILGDDPFGAGIDRLVQGRRVNDHAISIRRGARLSDLKDAHVLFIAASERDRAAQICSAAEDSHIVTVGDVSQTEPFTVINFGVERGRIVFTANLEAAQRASTRISSKLLHLAKSVRGSGQPGVVSK